MRKWLLGIILLPLAGCINWMDGEVIDLYKKRIKIKNGEVAWYYHSLISNITPDWVVVRQTARPNDTLCFVQNLCDVQVEDHCIQFVFSGPPSRYGKPAAVQSQSGDWEVVLDTAGQCR